MSLRRFRLVLNIGFGFLLVLCAGSVRADPAKIFGSGAFVVAGWIQRDDCRETSVGVVYNEVSTRAVGATGTVESSASLLVNVSIADFCTGTFTATSSEGTAELTLQSGLNDARLIGTAVGQTLPTGAAAEFAVDLTFIASSEVQRGFILQRQSVGNSFRSSSKFQSRIREAVATGSVRLNGLELISGPSGQGSLATNADSTFERDF